MFDFMIKIAHEKLEIIGLTKYCPFLQRRFAVASDGQFTSVQSGIELVQNVFQCMWSYNLALRCNLQGA